MLAPQQSPKLGPKVAPNAAKSSSYASKTTAIKGQQETPSSNLQRVSISQERLQAAVASCSSPSKSCSVVVDAAWCLQDRRILLQVREDDRSNAASAVPRCSPSSSPFAGKPSSPSQVVSNSGSQIQGLTPLELPPLVRQISGDGDEASASRTQERRCWLQVWEYSTTNGKDCPHQDSLLEPIVTVQLSSLVTALDVDEDDESRNLILCGYANGSSEIRSLPKLSNSLDNAKALLSVVQSWDSVKRVTEGNVRHVLFRGNPAGTKTAVVAQAGQVTAHDGGSCVGVDKASLAKSSVLLKAEALSMTSMGANSFALCNGYRVHAFEVTAPATAVNTAIVELPHGVTRVRHFSANLYEFFAVYDNDDSEKQQNAISAEWPCTEHIRQAPVEGQGAPPEPKNVKGRSLFVRAWARCLSGEKELVQVSTSAISLNGLLPSDCGTPHISTLAMHPISTSRWAGSYMLTIVAPGPGAVVFIWGVEASAELDKWREIRRQKLAEEAQLREEHCLHQKLQRLNQRIQETDRLEEKAKANGMDALTEEEQAKIQRRPQFEMEIQRISRELGLDDEEDNEMSEGEILAETEKEHAAAAVQRRHEKERQQKDHAENKRALQKERRKNREQKYVD